MQTPHNGYPVILNGDHAEFESEHANTPPHERPDWPLPSFDARDWAAAFRKVAVQLGYSDMDEGWLIAWFAGALMRGYDQRAAGIAHHAAPELLSIARRWAALDAGSWHPQRHASEKAELLADTRAAIAKATGGD